MARFSNPSGTRFYIWDLGTDNYNHQQLALNLDLIDAIIGFPNTGTWPTAGQSIYSYITALQGNGDLVGTVKMWQQVDSTQTVPAGTGGVPDAAGWHVADGTVMVAGSHDFRDSSGNIINRNITLPDYRNKMPIGANVAFPLGLVGTPGNGPAFAPGSMGAQGSNSTTTFTQTLPNHYHDHSHIHEVGNVLGGNFETGDASGNNTDTAANGTGVNVSKPGHTHHMDIYSSNARLPDDGNYKVSLAPNNNSQTQRTQTSLQKRSSGGTITDPTGGAAGDNLTVSVSADTRPASIGVIFIIRVKDSVVT